MFLQERDQDNSGSYQRVCDIWWWVELKAADRVAKWLPVPTLCFVVSDNWM